MNYTDIAAWFEQNLTSIITVIAFVIIEIPNIGEKLGWYSKKRKEMLELQKKERKAEYDQWTQDFLNSYIPTVTKAYDAKIKITEKHYEDINSKLTGIVLANVDLMRNEMKKIYYKYRKHKKIPEYDKQTFLKFYEHYHKFGGNTFIDSLYEEVCRWETVESIDDIPDNLD